MFPRIKDQPPPLNVLRACLRLLVYLSLILGPWAVILIVRSCI